MQDYSNVFNALSDTQKHNLFFNVLVMMRLQNRHNGWLRFDGKKFVFFDGKPSFEDAFEVNSVQLNEWVLELRQSIDNQTSKKK